MLQIFRTLDRSAGPLHYLIYNYNYYAVCRPFWTEGFRDLYGICGIWIRLLGGDLQ